MADKQIDAGTRFFSLPVEAAGSTLVQDRPMNVEDPVFTSEAILLLDGGNKHLVYCLLDLMVQERRRSNILPQQLEVTVQVDSETGKKLLHIKQTVATDAVRALAYWDKLSTPIDHWIQTLPGDQKEFVLDDVYMTVHWTD